MLAKGRFIRVAAKVESGMLCVLSFSLSLQLLDPVGDDGSGTVFC